MRGSVSRGGWVASAEILAVIEAASVAASCRAEEHSAIVGPNSVRPRLNPVQPAAEVSAAEGPPILMAGRPFGLRASDRSPPRRTLNWLIFSPETVDKRCGAVCHRGRLGRRCGHSRHARGSRGAAWWGAEEHRQS